MNISRASEEHAASVAKLFDLYRQFYECEPNLPLAEKYVAERIRNEESVIYFATDAGSAVGFVQMYPSFCSVDATKIYILYDLFVDASMRDAGIGKKLMNRAAKHAGEHGASRIDLQTAFSNKPGQHLYESLGYQKVLEDFHSYSLQL